MEHVIVQRTMTQPIRREELSKKIGAAEAMLDAYEVQFLHSYISADGLIVICHFAAPSVAAVENFNRDAGIPYDQAWAARLVSLPDE